MRQDLESRYQEFGRNNLAILILGMILVKIVHKIFSLGILACIQVDAHVVPLDYINLWRQEV